MLGSLFLRHSVHIEELTNVTVAKYAAKEWPRLAFCFHAVGC